MSGDERRTERVYVPFAPKELSQIDDWGFEQRIRSRAEVVRRLVFRGLDQNAKDEGQEAHDVE